MKVSDLFRKLSYGELSNLAIGTDGGGDILAAKKPVIVQHLNDALLRLYSRFTLREADVLIEQDALIRFYKLTSVNAVTNPAPAPGQVLFIKDSITKPFLDDVIRIREVWGTSGKPLPLNDPDNRLSVFTPQPDVLQVPKPVAGAPLGIIYQARHPIIAGTDYEVEVTIPAVLEQALTSYIAHLVYSNMNGQENVAQAAKYLSLYETICAEVTDRDLVNSSISATNTRFAKGGWV